MHETPLTGLILSGGGARAAYQVGVLEALAALRREAIGPDSRNPFAILCGTSAGAVNAAALACHADDFDDAVARIAAVWRDFRAEQVYRTDAISVLRGGTQWMQMLSIGRVLASWRRSQPKSLLDNAPLEELLDRLVPLDRLPRMLKQRHLQALAVSVSCYTSGEHISFFESAAEEKGYARSQRSAMPARLSHSHLMASAAIPFVFPARSLNVDGVSGWFGDGSMRQTAPIAPAIHLGAQRVLVIGVGAPQRARASLSAAPGYPTLAQIGGHAMSSIFIDGLSVDIERLERVNRTLALLTAEQRLMTPLQPVPSLIISPSQRIDEIAARHQQVLPRSVRALLRGVGSSSLRDDMRGAALASYLLFEAPFTRELMSLGAADTLARRDEVLAFFGWGPVRGPGEP